MDIHDLTHRLRELAAAMDAAGTLYAHDLIGQAADALEQQAQDIAAMHADAIALRAAFAEYRYRVEAAIQPEHIEWCRQHGIAISAAIAALTTMPREERKHGS